MLKQKAQAVFVREALKAKKLSLWEAFTAFDNDNNGLLSPAEFYGALIWLKVPDLTTDDVVDFLEAADTNRDGVIDYKEYVDMINPPGSSDPLLDQFGEDVKNLESLCSEEQSDRPARQLEKVEPYGGEQLREVIVHRRQTELLRLREERAHLAAYKEALDIKVFEEELLQSRKRKGGANPLVSTVNIPNCDKEIRQIDYKMFTNQLPLRLVPSGKNVFYPIFIGTAANAPVKPMDCPKKHGLFACNYSWMTCTNCRGRGIHYVCKSWCGFYLCSACYDGDRRAKEADRVNPAKHPTFLRCYNGCSFTVQIPAAPSVPVVDGEESKGENVIAEVLEDDLDFSVTLDIRVEKLPPKGHTLSLLRFSVPGMIPSRKKNTTNVFVDSNGRVICTFPTEKGYPVSSTVHNVLVTAPGPTSDTIALEAGSSSVDDKGKSSPSEASKLPAITPEVRKELPVVIRPSTWHIITVSVKPKVGSMCSFVDDNLCHVYNGKNADVNNLKLQHKLTVLGGGRLAEARGADIRRLVIHDKALGESCHELSTGYLSNRVTSGDISSLPLNYHFLTIAQDHPGIGGRALRIQTIYRGFIVRYRARKLAEAETEAAGVDYNGKESEKNDEDEE